MMRRCAAGLRNSADYFGTTAVSVADDIVGERLNTRCSNEHGGYPERGTK